MIDVQVAYDKLAGFDTAEEVAQFLIGERIKGRMGQAAHCAMADWFQRVTEIHAWVSNEGITVLEDEMDVWQRGCTDAMADFLDRFDQKEWPQLLTDPDQKTPVECALEAASADD